MDFARLSRTVERAAGSPWAFGAATVSILAWAATGPAFGWSDTWQLVCNTGTTIVTFLMVFLIQATQSQDTRALHAKLDELIRVIGPARNELIASEDLAPAALESMREQVRQEARE
jgi:low affinity Fe/Cu permease